MRLEEAAPTIKISGSRALTLRGAARPLCDEQVEGLGLQIAQSRSYLYTLCKKVGTTCTLGDLGYVAICVRSLAILYVSLLALYAELI